MVQILNPKQNLGDILGQSIGQGFSAGMQHRLMQQQKQQEEQRQRSLLEEGLTKVQQDFANPNLSPLEKQLSIYKHTHPDVAKSIAGSIHDYESSIAKSQAEAAKQKAYAERTEAMKNRPQGGLTGQPVPPEVGNKIKEIVQTNPADTADDLAIKFDEAGVPRGFSNSYIENRRRQDEAKASGAQREGEKVKRHTDISQDVLKRADEIAEALPQKESALGLMENAIANKDLSFWSKDNLAEATGIEGLRSPEGAIFKTAAKEYFLGNIARAGARPNQWIEQQISDMLTKIGRSPEANLSVARALRNELAIEKERVRLTEEISNELENSLGYVPRDLATRVNKELSKFAEKKQMELYNDLRAIKSIAEGSPQKMSKVEQGTPVSKFVAQALLKQYDNDPKKAREEAKRLGYAY